MSDEANTTSDADDAEAHGFRLQVEVDEADDTDDTEAHGLRGGVQPPDGEDDDTEGHVYPAGEDERDKRGQSGTG